jgi:hypothetical protein
LKRLVTLLAKAKRGPTNGKVPEKFSIVPRPLWALSDLEEASAGSNIAQADAAWIERPASSRRKRSRRPVRRRTFNGDKIQLVEVDPEKRALAAQEQAEADLEAQTNAQVTVAGAKAKAPPPKAP